MRAQGFKKRRNTFNRVISENITHQMSFFAPGAYSSEHGTFYFHFGVFCPQKNLYAGNDNPKNWVNDYDCCVRGIVGRLNKYHRSWEIEFSKVVLAEVDDSIERGIRVLDRFSSTARVLQTSDNVVFDDPLLSEDDWGFEPPLGILKACILIEDGHKLAATEEIRNYLHEARTSERPHLAHIDIVRDWAISQNLAID